MTFLCEYNIRKHNVWDLTAKSRPNSKKTIKISPQQKAKIKVFDIMSESEQNNEVREVTPSQEKAEQPTLSYEETTNSIEIVEESDVNDSVTIDSIVENVNENVSTSSTTTETTYMSPGEGSSWAVLEMIKNVIQIAFKN